MAQKDAKTIIPAYRGMSPYELPAELSIFQSQDMSKIGFMQDLTDGIERYLRSDIKDRHAPTTESTTGSSSGLIPLERLIKNGETYLKLDNYPSAEEVYTRITKEYPEDHRGWWGLMVCKTRNFCEVLLDQSQLNVWFRYVKQLADPKDFADLEKKYVDYTHKVSLLAAEEDMEAVRSMIGEHQEKIRGIENLIIEANEAIKVKNRAAQALGEKGDEAIQKVQNGIKSSKKKSATWIFSVAHGNRNTSYSNLP